MWLPALVAETGVRRQLRAARAILRHDFSVTYAAPAETTDRLGVSVFTFNINRASAHLPAKQKRVLCSSQGGIAKTVRRGMKLAALFVNGLDRPFQSVAVHHHANSQLARPLRDRDDIDVLLGDRLKNASS